MTAAGSLLIRPYRSGDRQAFEACNRWWLERYFQLEPIDERLFADPEGAILATGGQIFFAERDGRIVGTCALLMDEAQPQGCELAKMGVLPEAQGSGIGRRLARHALEWAAAQGRREAWLYSNRRLASALALYASLGFREVPLTPAERERYARTDIKMHCLLPATSRCEAETRKAS